MFYSRAHSLATREQGQRFFLKFDGNEGFGTPDLYKNGQIVPSSPFGTINVTSNSVRIESVNAGHQGNYIIRSSTGDELTYQLKVTGMEITSYTTTF